MCLQIRFSQHVSSSDAILDALHSSTFLALHCTTNPRVFTECVCNFLHFSTCLAPLHQESLVFTGFSSSDAKFPAVFHILAPIAPKILGFWQDFLSCDGTCPTFVHILARCAKNPGSFTGFALQTYTHHGASRIFKILQKLWLKTILSVKLLFTYSKRSPPEFIYARQFFTYSEITALWKSAVFLQKSAFPKCFVF